MIYTVELTDNARREIDQSYYWGCDKWGKTQAKKWFRGLMKAILELEEFPERHPLAPESDELKTPIRHLIYGRYRIVFEIENNFVRVLYCRGAHRGEKLN